MERWRDGDSVGTWREGGLIQIKLASGRGRGPQRQGFACDRDRDRDCNGGIGPPRASPGAGGWVRIVAGLRLVIEQIPVVLPAASRGRSGFYPAIRSRGASMVALQRATALQDIRIPRNDAGWRHSPWGALISSGLREITVLGLVSACRSVGMARLSVAQREHHGQVCYRLLTDGLNAVQRGCVQQERITRTPRPPPCCHSGG
jgi:hypothetical protein